ncbi:hypothetical protein [Pseudanabaena sp. 'Roaring Creek']|uniref:hypothetical protein n=1 Tax=Pseudanabaena sp. 'Roaring Creek' TaxID=1681830 RepID=UPI001E60511B|nr:hypothetical protein [Pseudanabaena sp. 'Roaring Creek']
MVEVEAKVIGRKRSPVALWQVSISQEGLTLRDLILDIVEAEVTAFRDRQEQQRLPQILTKDAIAWGMEKGKITSGDREFAPQPVDLQAAFEAAIQAFSDGLYYVFIDDRQYESLDEQVTLQPQSKVLFLRLVAMVGG